MSSFEITIFITLVVLCISIIFVYIFHLIAGVEYNNFIFTLSVMLPLLLSPPAIFVVLKLTKHLKEYRSFLEEEIEKNKAKDIIMYEQARFALMGEMMANISHQWKQPLNTINLSVASTKFSIYDNKRVEQCFSVVEDNVNYLATTVNDFLSFFDEKKYHDTKNISNIILEIRSIYETTLHENNIELNIELANDAQDIFIASSITQVILNLLSNANDAMSELDTKREITLRFITLDDMLKVRCCDKGLGVDEEVIKNIFDPYFTTKNQTRGTGLGLYMSKQIVHYVFDGDIYVDMFNHSCFILDLPYSETCRLEKK